MPGMTLTNVVFQYDGKWKINEQGLNEWCRGSNAGWRAMIVDDSNVTLQEVEDLICGKCDLNKNQIELKLSYVPPTPNYKSGPVYIHTSNCLKAFLYFGDVYNRPLLHVEIRNKIQTSANVVRDGFYFGDIADADADAAADADTDTGAGAFAGENEDAFSIDVDIDIPPNDFLANNVVEASSAIGKESTSSTPHHTGNEKDAHDEYTGEKNTDKENVVEENLGEENVHTRFESFDSERLDDDDRNLMSMSARSYKKSLAIGQEFWSKAEVQRELQKIAMASSFDLHVLKSTKILYSVRCANDNCSWKVRAAQIKNSAMFSIRTYCSKHTCDLVNQRSHRGASTALVAEMLAENLGEKRTIPAPKAIRTMMQNNGVEISYFKAWKGKQLAMNQLRGDPEENFKLLPTYLYMLEHMNPGSITHLETDYCGSFKYLFLAHSACISGFKYIRKVISVDSISLKGKYKCVMLVASAQDGNHNQYPIAWGVVDAESEASWIWFFQKLQEIIPDDDGTVFISSKDQVIIDGLASVYKQAHHGHCVWHLAQYIKTHLKIEECGVGLFIETSEAYKSSHFHALYNELNNKYPTITSYLENSTITRKWARAHFNGARFNIMTTNGFEFINTQLQSDRELPILALLDSIQHLASSWFNKHRLAASESILILTPWAEDIVNTRFNESREMTAIQLNSYKFHVKGKGHDATVDLSRKSCSCRAFDIDRLPCVHAIAAHQHAGMNLYDLCSFYYTRATWALAYTETINPVLETKGWKIPPEFSCVDVLPPKVKVGKDRGKKKRISSVEEFVREKHCRLCGQSGHYRTKCQNKTN